MDVLIRVASAAALAAVCAAGCSVLVDGDPEPVGCSAEGQIGPPACDEGYRCSAGACLQCVADCAGDGSPAGEAGAVAR